jgi:hypothetical protein
MRSVLAAVAALATVAAAAAAPAATSATRHSVRCKNVNYDSDAGYYVYASTRIRALRVRCSLARRVARVNPSNVAGKGSEPRRFRSNGFVCRGRRSSTRVVPFRCTRRTSTITFTWTTR